MYRRNKLLKEEAEKRLAAIREFTELGSGIKIAMRDLEIRGAETFWEPSSTDTSRPSATISTASF